jgi:hypothetical protein
LVNVSSFQEFFPKRGAKMKNKKIVLAAVTFLLLVAFGCVWGRGAKGSQVSSNNLVLNGGFETLSEDRPVSWKEGRSGGWKVETEKPYGQDRAMQATIAWSWLEQEIKAKANRNYILKAYIRSDITIPEKEDYANTFLTLECLNWRKKVIKRDYGIVNATPSWQLKIREIRAPRGTRRIRIKLAKRQGEGSVWFDEVKLFEVPSGLVVNPSFESISKDRPVSWKEDPLGGWEVEKEKPYEGERAMRGTKAWSWLWQEIKVKAKKYYLLQVYVRSDITIPQKKDYENTFLSLECLDGKHRVIGEDLSITNATSSWELKMQQIYTPPKTKKIRIKLAKRQGEGSVWFDRVKLFEIPSLMVFNPSFETLRENKPESWKEDPKGGWKVTTEEPHAGKNCMRAATAWSWLWQDIPVGARTYYILRAYVRSNIIVVGKEDLDNAFFSLECLDKNGKVIRETYKTFNASFSWEQKEGAIWAAEGTEKIRIKLAKRQGEGSVWFDEVELVKQRFMANIFKDKGFFIFYISLYLVLGISLLRLVLKKGG